MRYLSPALAAVTLLVTGACAAPTPTDLFPTADFAGWEFVTEPATALGTVCVRRPDGVITAAGKPVGFIATTASYENYRLHAEWRWPGKPGCNGGVLLHISSGPKDRAWPLCFQVQTKNGNAGDFLPMAGATFAEKLSTPLDAKTAILNHAAPDSEKPVGEWNTCDITCRNGTVEVTINGVLQNHVTQAAPRAGRIGFQFEGSPFELRNVTVVRLD